MLMLYPGVRKYGVDFAAIAEVIGNKTAAHVRNFFIAYRQRFHLDDMLHDAEHRLRSSRSAKLTKHSNVAQSSQVREEFVVV